jgi:hypothetical protein
MKRRRIEDNNNGGDLADQGEPDYPMDSPTNIILNPKCLCGTPCGCTLSDFELRIVEDSEVTPVVFRYHLNFIRLKIILRVFTELLECQFVVTSSSGGKFARGFWNDRPIYLVAMTRVNWNKLMHAMNGNTNFSYNFKKYIKLPVSDFLEATRQTFSSRHINEGTDDDVSYELVDYCEEHPFVGQYVVKAENLQERPKNYITKKEKQQVRDDAFKRAKEVGAQPTLPVPKYHRITAHENNKPIESKPVEIVTAKIQTHNVHSDGTIKNAFPLHVDADCFKTTGYYSWDEYYDALQKGEADRRALPPIPITSEPCVPEISISIDPVQNIPDYQVKNYGNPPQEFIDYVEIPPLNVTQVRRKRKARSRKTKIPNFDKDYGKFSQYEEDLINECEKPPQPPTQPSRPKKQWLPKQSHPTLSKSDPIYKQPKKQWQPKIDPNNSAPAVLTRTEIAPLTTQLTNSGVVVPAPPPLPPQPEPVSDLYKHLIGHNYSYSFVGVKFSFSWWRYVLIYFYYILSPIIIGLGGNVPYYYNVLVMVPLQTTFVGTLLAITAAIIHVSYATMILIYWTTLSLLLITIYLCMLYRYRDRIRIRQVRRHKITNFRYVASHPLVDHRRETDRSFDPKENTNLYTFRETVADFMLVEIRSEVTGNWDTHKSTCNMVGTSSELLTDLELVTQMLNPKNCLNTIGMSATMTRLANSTHLGPFIRYERGLMLQYPIFDNATRLCCAVIFASRSENRDTNLYNLLFLQEESTRLVDDPLVLQP